MTPLFILLACMAVIVYAMGVWYFWPDDILDPDSADYAWAVGWPVGAVLALMIALVHKIIGVLDTRGEP